MRWALIIAISWFSGAVLADTNGPGRLTINGQGVINASPDMATITMGVSSRAETAAGALGQTSAATGELLTLLSEIGIEQADMQTTGLSLSPIWKGGSSSKTDPVPAGFAASNNVTLRVRALGDLGAILDDVVQNGANQFHGLRFGLQEPGPVQDEARRAAVADALRKAELIAESAGVELGPILEISEGGVSMPSPGIANMARLESVPIAEGELSVRAFVTMVFAIE